MDRILKLMVVFVCCMSLTIAADAAEEGKEILDEQTSLKKSDSSDWGVHHSARVILKGIEEGSLISGRVDFVQTGDGLQMVVSLSNVMPAGKHGIHIHEGDSCEDGGKAAGGHFNPVGTPHGLLVRDGQGKAHAGDLGNIEIKDDGTGTLILFLPGLSLTEGYRNIAGRAMILHEKEDDFGQPTGNAGSRIACGIIIMNK